MATRNMNTLRDTVEQALPLAELRDVIKQLVRNAESAFDQNRDAIRELQGHIAPEAAASMTNALTNLDEAQRAQSIPVRRTIAAALQQVIEELDLPDGIRPKKVTSDRKSSVTLDEVSDALDQEPKPVKTIAGKLSISTKQARRHLEKLVNDGAAMSRQRGREKLYSLTTTTNKPDQ